MTTIIGIFDNARDLDKAVNKLARAGFEETVYDESIVAEDTPKGGPIAFALGSYAGNFLGQCEAGLAIQAGPQRRHSLV